MGSRELPPRRDRLDKSQRRTARPQRTPVRIRLQLPGEQHPRYMGLGRSSQLAPAQFCSNFAALPANGISSLEFSLLPQIRPSPSLSPLRESQQHGLSGDQWRRYARPQHHRRLCDSPWSRVTLSVVDSPTGASPGNTEREHKVEGHRRSCPQIALLVQRNRRRGDPVQSSIHENRIELHFDAALQLLAHQPSRR
jgi:hypothetical protein